MNMSSEELSFIHHLKLDDQQINLILKSLELSKQHFNAKDRTQIELFLEKNQWRVNRQQKSQSDVELLSVFNNFQYAIQESFDSLHLSPSQLRNPLAIKTLLDDLGVIENDITFVNSFIDRQKSVAKVPLTDNQRQKISAFISTFTTEHYFNQTNALADHSLSRYSSKYEKQIEVLIAHFQSIPKPSSCLNILIFSIDALMNEKAGNLYYEQVKKSQLPAAITNMDRFSKYSTYKYLTTPVLDAIHEAHQIHIKSYVHPNARKNSPT